MEKAGINKDQNQENYNAQWIYRQYLNKMPFGFKTSNLSTSMSIKSFETNIERSDMETKGKYTVAKRIRAFAEKTSCHGIQRIIDSEEIDSSKPSQPKRFFWLLLILSSCGMACYNLVEIMQDYNSYPTTTLINQRTNAVVDFPAVTFCNINFAVPDRLFRNDLIIDLWKQMSSLDHRKRRNEKERTMSLFSVLTDEEKKIAAHQLTEMLLDCQFGEISCGVGDFRAFYSYRRGICYSFNTGKFGFVADVNQLEKTGEGNGLTLTLDVQSDQYLPFTDNIGIYLKIYKSSEFPDIDKNTVMIPPGFHTNLGLTITERIEAGPPYGQCVPTGSLEKKRNMYSIWGVGYSQSSCVESCAQVITIRECGCCDPNTPCNPAGTTEMFGTTFHANGPDGDGFTDCNATDVYDVKCMEKIQSKLSKETTCDDECPPECKKISFQIERDMSLWPHQQYASAIFKDMNGSSRAENVSSVQQELNFVRENVVKVGIHFSTRNSVVITTQPAYTWNTLLGNIGGQLGLWLGFSILTAFEYLELLWDILAGGVMKAWSRKTSRCAPKM